MALSSDGNTGLVGSLANSVWVFGRSGEEWSQQGERLTGSGETGNSFFGWSVALSADGSTVLIGGPSDNGNTGAAWVFRHQTLVVTDVHPTVGPEGGTLVTITGAGFTNATSVRFGSTDAAGFVVNSDNSITAISPAGTGLVDVILTGPEGTSPFEPTDLFHYVAPAEYGRCIKVAKGTRSLRQREMHDGRWPAQVSMVSGFRRGTAADQHTLQGRDQETH